MDKDLLRNRAVDDLLYLLFMLEAISNDVWDDACSRLSLSRLKSKL